MTSKTSNIDEAVEAAFEPLRGNPQADRAAAVLSNLADYGLIWVVLAGIKARRRGPSRRRAVVALAAAGFSSLIVNRVVKKAFERERPAAGWHFCAVVCAELEGAVEPV